MKARLPVMRLKEPLLLLFLLAAEELNAQGAVGAGAQAPRGSGPKGEYEMKLCGRDFIRALIFICGGSRWKRLSERRGAEEPWLGGGASVGEWAMGGRRGKRRDVQALSGFPPFPAGGKLDLAPNNEKHFTQPVS